MNSRYMRPPPQTSRVPMQPMQWPTITPAPPPQIAPDTGGASMMQGMGLLGSAAIKRFGGEDEPEAPEVNVQAEKTIPVVEEPPIPVPPTFEYGAPPQSAMARKKPSLIEMIMGGGQNA